MMRNKSDNHNVSLNHLRVLKWKLSICDLLGFSKFPVQSNAVHLKGALEWIKRAQDATPDRGVSRLFSLRDGWQPSYPETTGYIIPTFLAYTRLSGESDFRHRALDMADWLIQIQMDCGAIQAGGVEVPEKVPTIFNTGQVLFGLVAAFKETGRQKYRVAATKAADWLAEHQEPDGSWKTFHSPFAAFRDNTYNARTAWGLYEVNEIIGDGKYTDAAVRNLKLVVSRQNQRGWFSKNCLCDRSRPLTHTIGYTIEGLLGVGLALSDEVFIRAAERAARALIAVQRKDGSLAGRYDGQWRPQARWSCLTGVAQIAICWWKLHSVLGDECFLEAARRANAFLKSTQDLRSPHPAVRGGIKGSHPIFGNYCSYQYPNWAAKFLADSLIREGRAGRVILAGAVQEDKKKERTGRSKSCNTV